MDWEWSDAWLMMSVEMGSSKGIDLRDLIAIGDRINQSIFSSEELTRGLRKLVSIDFLKIKNEQFSKTRKFTSQYKKIEPHPKAMLKATDQVLELLKKYPLDESKMISVDASPVTEDKVKEAYQKYMSRF
ncbi:hypothetical protein WSM22_12740 [Cytophagales bacterium WSM2-2]|nr:hypothetical protein WSM22_12740 [Cytophagales bacterium WSM2-2]